MSFLMTKYEKQLTPEEKTLAKKSMLHDDFPMAAVFYSAIFGSVLALSAIGLQILGIIVKCPLYYIATGIWTGSYLLVLEILALILILTRSIAVSEIYILLKLVSIVFVSPLPIFNAIAIAQSDVYPSPFLWINIALLCIGIVSYLNNLIGSLGLLTRRSKHYKLVALSSKQDPYFSKYDDGSSVSLGDDQDQVARF